MDSEFCQLSTYGSFAGAANLNQQQTDKDVNWAGRLQHTKTSEASGFCYVRETVLAILEPLKCHQRVLYVVVMTLNKLFTTDPVNTISMSVHKYGVYFPSNFPVRDGIDDVSYAWMFNPIASKVMEVCQPA